MQWPKNPDKTLFWGGCEHKAFSALAKTKSSPVEQRLICRSEGSGSAPGCGEADEQAAVKWQVFAAHDLAKVLTGRLAPVGLQFGTNGNRCAKFELTAFNGEATF